VRQLREVDQRGAPSYWKQGSGVTEIPDDPKSFLSDSFDLTCAPGQDLGSLGDLRTDEQGRLLVVAASGPANGRTDCQLQDDVNNDGWFDDIGDGPVDAVIEFDDGSVQEVQAGAWVVTTDPGYAPQTLNVVSLFDDIFDSWVRKLGLRPDVYADGAFQTTCQPVFEDEVLPVFRAAELQQWNTNLDDRGREQHDKVGQINAKPLQYGAANSGAPFLTIGWTPERNDTSGLEPGDVSKLMALPWHTDYNSCATHPASLPDPVVAGKTISSGHYWSWPAERPVAVYRAEDVVGGKLGVQQFSVRGPGTFTADDNETGRRRGSVPGCATRRFRLSSCWRATKAASATASTGRRASGRSTSPAAST